jgi:rhamnogalacturonyl hydrolase YesR
VKKYNEAIVILLVIVFCREVSSAQSAHRGKDFIKRIMTRVCDYQLNHLKDSTVMANGIIEAVPSNGWVRGVFFTGVLSTFESTGEQKYFRKAMQWAERNNWNLGPKLRHADDQVVAQTYIQLYEIKPDPKMIAHCSHVFDQIVANPMFGQQVGWSKDNNWSWSDALFMAPPAFAMLSKVTNEEKYIAIMDSMWWETSDYLYDESDSLYYRDINYKPVKHGKYVKEPNGRKVFWSRGNGWVLAGLARTLAYMSLSYKNRSRFEKQFLEMAYKLKNIQPKDGLWRSSLYDTTSYPDPETSGSSLFCFAMAWGINNNLLPADEFRPVVLKTWNALVKRVNRQGRLGSVQRVGHKPTKVYPGDTNEYAAGAFLNAANEILKMK